MARQCPACQLAKPLTDYHTRKSGPRKGQAVAWCKPCGAEKRIEAKKRNPDTYQRIERKAKLKRQYGISLDDYNSMLAFQQGGCAICKRKDNDRFHKHFAVDHDHKTGKVRGLLCTRCNQALGYFNDDPLLLTAAINYLIQHHGGFFWP